MSDLGGNSDQTEAGLDNPDVEILVLAAPADVEVGEAVDGCEVLAGDGGHPPSVLQHEQLVLEPVHSLGWKYQSTHFTHSAGETFLGGKLRAGNICRAERVSPGCGRCRGAHSSQAGREDAI